MKTIFKMNRHAKLHKPSYQSNSKWWILTAALTMLLVVIFVGLVVFLGLTNDGDSKPNKNQRDPSTRYQDKRRSEEGKRKREEQVRKVLEEEVKREQEAHVEEVTKDFKEIRKELESLAKDHRQHEDHSNSDHPPVKPHNDDDKNTVETEVENTASVHSSPESLIGHDEVLGDIDSAQDHDPELKFHPSEEDPTFTTASPAIAEVMHTQDESSTHASIPYSEPQTPTSRPERYPQDQTSTYPIPSQPPTQAIYYNNDPLQRRALHVGNNVRDNKITFFSEFKPMPKHDVKPLKANDRDSQEIIADEYPLISAMFDGPEHRISHDHEIGSLEQDVIFDQDGPAMSSEPSVGSFLNTGVRDVYNWLSADNTTQYENGSLMNDLKTVLKAVNSSIVEGNPNILLWKLKEMYKDGANDAVINVTDPSILSNSTSLVSVGLLAFDLLLLRSVQQIAWEDQEEAKELMMKDPEVVAMNALFMTPEQMRDFQNPKSRIDAEEPGKGLLEELLGFVNSTMRAIVMLGRAYRSSVVGRNMENRETGNGVGNATTMDCIWTLYCRNLDKTAKLDGLYGFLAKMNGLGLRLVMGEFPLETALDLFIKEAVQGSTRIKCEKLFPNCSPKTAAEVVMNIVLSSQPGSEPRRVND